MTRTKFKPELISATEIKGHAYIARVVVVTKESGAYKVRVIHHDGNIHSTSCETLHLADAYVAAVVDECKAEVTGL